MKSLFYIITLLAVLGSYAAFAVAKTETSPPTDPFVLVNKACAQDDAFIREAIMARVAQLYPKKQKDLDMYFANDCIMPNTAMVQKPKDTAKKRKTERFGWWHTQEVEGSVEANADWRTGDTRQRNLQLAGNLKHTIGRYRSVVEASARHSTEQEETIAEEYRALLRSDYKLDDRWFIFGEVSYVDDRFSGYDYRLSELLGPGYIIYDRQDFQWEARGGAGARQEKLTNGESSQSFLVKLQTDLEWTFANGWSIGEEASASFSEENDIYESETYLKSRITDSLALKAAYYIEYIANAPDSTQAADTRTLLGIVYDF